MKKTSSLALALFFTITSLSLSVTSIHSAEPNSDVADRIKEKQLEKEKLELKKKDQCISRFNEQTSALVAQDWDNLNRLARIYTKDCKNVFNDDWLSISYENIATSNNHNKKYKIALVASNDCIKAGYGNPGCSIQKAEALASLGKKTEALKSLDISEKLARYNLEGAKHSLNQASSELDKELYNSAINKNESYLNLIDATRSKLIQ